MSPDNLSDAELLLEEGIEAARAGDHARARDLLSLAVSRDASQVRGWLWLSGEVEGLEDRAFCLRRVLALEPDNRVARRGLAWLQERAGLEEQAQSVQDLREAVGERATPEAAVESKELEPAGRGQSGIEREAEGIVEKPRESVEAPRLRPAEQVRGRSTERAGLVVRNEFVFIAILGLALLALIALGVEGLPAPLPLLRLLLGLAFVLFVPGYALQAALFPRDDDLDGPERLALSFGLSVAVVPSLALILDWLPWGIRLWPIVAGEGLVIVTLSAVALIRRRRLPAGERPVLAIDVDVKGWWAGQDRTARVLYGVLAGALLLAVASAAAIILLPKPGEQFTEFYVLGPDGLAEGYPREAAPGQALTVTAGIANREGVAAEYRIEIRVGGETIGGAGPLALQDGEVWEAPLTYALPHAGEDQQVEFLLYRDGGAEPYRRLRLWLDVVEAPGAGDG